MWQPTVLNQNKSFLPDHHYLTKPKNKSDARLHAHLFTSELKKNLCLLKKTIPFPFSIEITTNLPSIGNFGKNCSHRFQIRYEKHYGHCL